MKYKIYNYTYIPGDSYIKSGFKGRGPAYGTVINKETGAYIAGGGNGTYVVVIPAKIIIRAASESRDIKSLEIGPLLRQCVHSLHRRLTSDFAQKICENLIGKEFNDENEINDIEKLIYNIIS